MKTQKLKNKELTTANLEPHFVSLSDEEENNDSVYVDRHLPLFFTTTKDRNVMDKAMEKAKQALKR